MTTDQAQILKLQLAWNHFMTRLQSATISAQTKFFPNADMNNINWQSDEANKQIK